MRSFLALLVLLAVIAGGGAIWGPSWYSQELNRLGPSTEAQTVRVLQGESATSVLERLKDRQIIHNDFVARLSLRFNPASVKAGEYEIPAGASLNDVLAILKEGKSKRYSVTLPEGLTVLQIVERLNKEPMLSGEVTRLPAEGSLMPNTYFIQRGDTRQGMIERMERALLEAIWPIWEARDPDLPYSRVEEMLTLASIVEKETALGAERPVVASVYINRLRQGMRLDADPTLEYFESNGYGELGYGLRQSQIDRDHAYNTRRRKGLPPGPIANVGKEALIAVTKPAKTDFLYFVADGTGGHAFSKTLAEHNRNVRKWREIERARN